ncbi:MAG: hypothetical protein ABDH28_04980, partial [Brevinematia bacterium]
YEFIHLLSTEFELVNRESVKRVIINSLKNKNMIWLLLEIKNVLSSLYNQNPNTNLRNISKNVEKFLDNYEFSLIFKNNPIRVLTPLFDRDKYLGDINYVKKTRERNVILISQDNEIRVALKGNGIVIGKINPNTTRIVSELGGTVLSSKLIIPRFISEQVNYLPEVFDLWIEINLLRL